MIQELLYTSHEGRGLRQGGGGGFCTVLSTTGMASNLAAALEKLSGYKHPFDIHDARSQQNPVNFRHAIIRVGGTTYHVLSRVADLRGEHTGRSNKLAHHVVLTQADLVAGGPTRLLTHAGFSREDWDGKVALVEPVPRAALPNDDLPVEVCRNWLATAGDAGWAGHVADKLLAGPAATVNVIFPLGVDTLALANEVFSLLPPAKRWEVTFSTYYAASPPISTCNLRFVLDGTADAEQLRRDYRQTVIDLANLSKEPAMSGLVTAARSGKLDRGKTTRLAVEKIIDATEESSGGALQDVVRLSPMRNRAAESGELELMPPTLKEPVYESRRTRPSFAATGNSRRERYRKSTLVALIASSALLVGISITLLTYRVYRQSTSRDSVSEHQEVNPRKAKLSIDAPVDSSLSAGEPGNSPRDSLEVIGEADPGASQSTNTASIPNTRDTAAASVANGATQVTEPPGNNPYPTTGGADSDSPGSTKASAGGQVPPVTLKIPTVSDVQPLGYKLPLPISATIESISDGSAIQGCNLIGLDWIATQWQLLSEATGESLEWKETTSSTGKRVWAVVTVMRQPTSKSPAPQLCSFSFDEGKLTFQWEGYAKTKIYQLPKKAALLNALRWCPLEIVVEGNSEFFRLSDPILTHPVQLFPLGESAPIINTALPLPSVQNSRVKMPLRADLAVEVNMQGITAEHSQYRSGGVTMTLRRTSTDSRDRIALTLSLKEAPKLAGCDLDIQQSIECYYLVESAPTAPLLEGDEPVRSLVSERAKPMKDLDEIKNIVATTAANKANQSKVLQAKRNVVDNAMGNRKIALNRDIDTLTRNIDLLISRADELDAFSKEVRSLHDSFEATVSVQILYSVEGNADFLIVPVLGDVPEAGFIADVAKGVR